MNILVTSIVDLKRVRFNRIHVFLNHLSQKHHITALCLNAWWLEKDNEKDADSGCRRDPYFRRVFDKVEIIHLTERRIPPVLQEVFSIVGLYRLLRKTDQAAYDIHINYSSLLSGLFVTKMLQSEGVPTVFDVADDLPAAFRVSAQIPVYLRWLAGSISRILLHANVNAAAKTTFVTESLRSAYALATGKSAILPNGVDVELFKASPSQEVRSKMDISPDDFVLGYMGILDDKWVDFGPIFQAVKGLASSIPRLRMIVIGNGRGADRLRLDVEQCDLMDNVRFSGYVAHERVPAYISCMDACVIPFTLGAMTNNASPIKLFEYMACGRPVISTPMAGVIEAVDKRVLYAADAVEWEKRITQLYENVALRTRMGKDGRDFVRNIYSRARICSEFEALLMDVAGRSAELSGKEG